MCSFLHCTSTGQSFERRHGQRQNPVPCPSFVILPRKIYVIQDIDQILSHQQSPVRSTIMECYAQSSSKLLNFHRVKAHQVQSMATSIAFHRQASMEQIPRACIWRCHYNFTDFYLKDIPLPLRSHSPGTNSGCRDNSATNRPLGVDLFIPHHPLIYTLHFVKRWSQDKSMIGCKFYIFRIKICIYE